MLNYSPTNEFNYVHMQKKDDGKAS